MTKLFEVSSFVLFLAGGRPARFFLMPKFARHVLILFVLLMTRDCCQSAHAADAFADAAQLYQKSQWQQAAAAFDRIAQDSQQDQATRLAARLFAGESLMQHGDYLEARQRFLLVHQQHPPARLAAQSLFRLGEAAWLAGQHEEATQLLQMYLDRYPSGASTSYANSYLQQIRSRWAPEPDRPAAVRWRLSRLRSFRPVLIPLNVDCHAQPTT